MKTTNEFAYDKWCQHAGSRRGAEYTIYDLKHEPTTCVHWFAKVFVFVLRFEAFLHGLAMDFWGMFWRFK